MDTLDAAIKRLIKETVKEGVGEALREQDFWKAVLAHTAPAPVLPKSKKLAVKIPEAAEMLSVSAQTVRRMVANGTLKASRKTRHVLIPISELERIMKV